MSRVSVSLKSFVLCSPDPPYAVPIGINVCLAAVSF